MEKCIILRMTSQRRKGYWVSSLRLSWKQPKILWRTLRGGAGDSMHIVASSVCDLRRGEKALSQLDIDLYTNGDFHGKLNDADIMWMKRRYLA